MTKKKSHSYSQPKIKAICDEICDNIEPLFDHFGLDYKQTNRMITMCCPIHGGDNPSAINVYPTGDEYRGNWVCRTHNCQHIFQPSIIGFIRGILSATEKNWQKSGDDMYSFNDTIDFALKFIKKEIGQIKVCKKKIEKQQFTSTINTITTNLQTETTRGPSRTSVRKLLKIPSLYFSNRGFDEKILNKYDVGLCDNSTKEMYNRVVVPIYDNNYEYMVGCTGRSIFEKCNQCKSYHDQTQSCPEDRDVWKYSKWRHNKDFKTQNHLYNYWFAQKHIKESGVAIVVESPGNVWKLEECGIHNAVGIFGTNLTDRQKMILDTSGAMSLVILMDNDEAGKQASIKIKQKCIKTYNMYFPQISKADVGDMTCEEIKTEIIEYIKKEIK